MASSILDRLELLALLRGRNRLIGPPDLEFDFPQPDREDEEYVAELRRTIAEAQVTQKRQGSRAANQAIIEKVGLRHKSEHSELYYSRALDYHLGILQAHLGEAEAAAFHFGRSRTLPSEGGDHIFSDHRRDSLELGKRQKAAIKRGIPAITLTSMPRSASAVLSQKLSRLLDAPLMRVSSGAFPNYYIVPHWLRAFSRGGAVLHDHFGANSFNLNTLLACGIRDVFVRVRDPRSAAASAAHLAKKTYNIGVNEEYMIWDYERAFIPWLAGWIAAASDLKTGLRVHFLAQPSPAIDEAARAILSVLSTRHWFPLGATHRALKRHIGVNIPTITANFVHGDEQAWRKAVSEEGQKRMWDATPPAVRDLLMLRA